ncbi:uncharacterized protein [Diadema setosum]|uniref:uncharacterized protein n=1 Tax=Diadema setosum TaxID=31175 RepID=UPI003B3AB91B
MGNGATLYRLDMVFIEPSVVIRGVINVIKLNVSVHHNFTDTGVTVNDTDSAGNQTASIWRLSVWGSSINETNGTHQVSLERQALDTTQKNQLLPSNGPLTFQPSVEYRLNLSKATCQQGSAFLCARLVPRQATDSGYLHTCIPGLPCRDGVIIHGVQIRMKSPVSVEWGVVNKLRFNVSILYNRTVPNDITGDNLWHLKIWGEVSNDTSGRLSLVDQALTQSQASQSLIAGEAFEFLNVEYDLDLTEISCGLATKICVRFRRGENATYELQSKPNASIRTQCIPVNETCPERIRNRYSTPYTTTEVPGMTTPTFVEWLSRVLKEDGSRQNEDQSPEEVSAELAHWTNELDDVSGEELSLTGQVIDQLSNIEDVSPEVATNVVDVIDNIIAIDSTSKKATDIKDDGGESISGGDVPPASLVKSVERLISNVKLSKNTTSNFSTSRENIAVALFNIVPQTNDQAVAGHNRNVMRVRVRDELDKLNESGNARELVFETVDDSAVDGLQDTEVAVELETGTLLKSIDGPNSGLRIDLIVFRNDSLFASAASTSTGSHGNPSGGDSGGGGGDCRIKSKVLSVSVRQGEEEITDLETPINMTFKIHKNDPTYTPTCTYWDFDLNNGLGDWSTLGCDLVDESEDQAVCSCDHLTNFAVLMAPSYGCHPYALDIVSQVGCVVSALGLIATIVTYVMFGKQMGQTPRLIMIQWCISLLCLYVVFIVGIDQTHSSTGCTVVAALLHYFTLASVLWMGVEGANLYILLVRVLDVPATRRFIPIACAVAWGIPVGFVMLGVFHRGPEKYREGSFCFLSRGPHFIYTLLLPLAVVLLANVVCYVIVMRTLICSRAKIRVIKMEKGKLHDLATRLQQALAIGLLMGLTWLFGFFAIGKLAAVFAWLFCICNSLQGVCIFLLFCIFRPELRRAWKRQCCPSLKLRPQRRGTAKSSELDNLRCSRSTSVRESCVRSTTASGNTWNPPGKLHREFSSESTCNRTLSG